MSYFVEDLVESIKTRSLAPIAQTTFDDAKLIEMANEVLTVKLAVETVELFAVILAQVDVATNSLGRAG